jgi:DNA-binding NarL/FixJ family response regulator
MSDQVRVLIADDHPVFRDGLASLLATQPDVAVVATAADGAEAVRLSAELAPDVVVMDLQMPEMNGIEATRAIAEAQPDVRVLVFTMGEEDGTVLSAMRAGARGYLVKGADSPDIERAITAVARGEAIFGPGVAERVLGYLTRPLSARDDVVFPELTDRERDVLELLAGGHGNGDIARSLSLSPKTVRNNVSSIFAKLQVADRSEAIVRARRAGLGVGDAERR